MVVGKYKVSTSGGIREGGKLRTVKLINNSERLKGGIYKELK